MNTINPKVSVRMSAYNHDGFVEQAVLSIVNQTFKDFELIVIDDGSSDQTPFILERLSKEHGFYFERQENMGLSKTLNKITSLSRGEYICGVASDDYYHEDKLQKIVPIMESNPELGVVHARCDFVNEAGQKIESSQYKRKRLDICEGNIFEHLLVEGCFIDAASALIRKSALDVVGGYDEDLAIEDWDMWLRLADKFPFGYLEEIVAYYRCHEGGTYRNPAKDFTMMSSEDQIIDKWAGRPGYRIARRKFNLRWFAKHALAKRASAVRFGLSSLPSVASKRYWRAWYHLLKI
jgi:glycosyltransferase involved in cell wall biosynthesis